MILDGSKIMVEEVASFPVAAGEGGDPGIAAIDFHIAEIVSALA